MSSTSLTNGAVATIVSERSCSRNVSTLGGSPARHTGDLRSAGPPTGSRFKTIRERPAMAFNRIGASGPSVGWPVETIRTGRLDLRSLI